MWLMKTLLTSGCTNQRGAGQKLAESYNKLDSAGYEVINIVPINIGSSDQCFQENKNYVGDVGYSITRGAVVVGKLKSEGND